MSWVEITLWALSNAPAMVSIVRDIIKLTKTLPVKTAKEIQAAAAIQISTGNNDLESVKKKCEGIACPMETKHE